LNEESKYASEEAGSGGGGGGGGGGCLDDKSFHERLKR